MKIDIPCRVGDMVWGIFRGGGNARPKLGRVREIYFCDSDMTPAIQVHKVGIGHWGKDVFATEREAWERIREMKENECQPVR